MDPFAVIALGGLAGLVLALGLVMRPRGRAATAAEPDDVDALLEALNARRRRRGEGELTADGVRGDHA